MRIFGNALLARMVAVIAIACTAWAVGQTGLAGAQAVEQPVNVNGTLNVSATNNIGQVKFTTQLWGADVRSTTQMRIKRGSEVMYGPTTAKGTYSSQYKSYSLSVNRGGVRSGITQSYCLQVLANGRWITPTNCVSYNKPRRVAGSLGTVQATDGMVRAIGTGQDDSKDGARATVRLSATRAGQTKTWNVQTGTDKRYQTSLPLATGFYTVCAAIDSQELGCKNVRAQAELGWLDQATALGDGGRLRVSGWVMNRTTEPKTLEWKVRLNYNSGRVHGSDWKAATNYRQDLRDKYGSGNHGFDQTFTGLPAGTTKVSLFARPLGDSSANPVLISTADNVSITGNLPPRLEATHFIRIGKTNAVHGKILQFPFGQHAAQVRAWQGGRVVVGATRVTSQFPEFAVSFESTTDQQICLEIYDEHAGKWVQGAADSKRCAYPTVKRSYNVGRDQQRSQAVCPVGVFEAWEAAHASEFVKDFVGGEQKVDELFTYLGCMATTGRVKFTDTWPKNKNDCLEVSPDNGGAERDYNACLAMLGPVASIRTIGLCAGATGVVLVGPSIALCLLYTGNNSADQLDASDWSVSLSVDYGVGLGASAGASIFASTAPTAGATSGTYVKFGLFGVNGSRGAELYCDGEKVDTLTLDIPGGGIGADLIGLAKPGYTWNFGGNAEKEEAYCAQFEEDTTTNNPGPSSPPVVTSGSPFVAVAGYDNEAWYLHNDGTRQWLDQNCRQQLTNTIGTPRLVNWNTTLANRPDTPGTARKSCTQLQTLTTTDTEPTNPPPPATSGSDEFVVINGYNDGWILRADGTRQWINQTCRQQLTNNTGTPRTADWNTELKNRPDTTPTNRKTCDQLQASI